MFAMSDFLNIIHLYMNSMTRIVVEGREVLIEKISNQIWKVSTPVYQGAGEFPQEIHECLKLVQTLKWAREGRLEVDGVTGMIHWTHRMGPSNFGKELPRFLQNAQEWAEVLPKTFLSLA